MPLSGVRQSFFFLMIRRPPRSTQGVSSAASDVYKRQYQRRVHGTFRECRKTIGQYIALILGLSATIFVHVGLCVSRLYLGVHSLNQVVFGTLLGLWGTHFCVGVISQEWAEKEITNSISSISSQQIIKSILLPIIVYLIFLLPMLYFYFSLSHTEKYRPLSFIQIYELKCHKKGEFFNPVGASLTGICDGSVFLMMYFAQILSAYFFPSLILNWPDIGSGIFSEIVRVAIALLPVLFGKLGPGYFLPHLSFWKYIGYGILLPNICASFLMGISDYLIFVIFSIEPIYSKVDPALTIEFQI
eukprot:TRINITY_DN65540_c0_g1_i2.p1 TRINITY_DN65540_c0_g1~~TRINITY_DN65540_c0_g1_i2.p1  ORF type:complete len:301 (+),score=27.30 TRINITY_DN65540_c0_g1_i2:76-978(+)